MPWGELSGYAASLLVFVAFYMKGMMPLRLVAIASNAAFIAYALAYGLMPILMLHGALLPLNVARLLELRRRAAEVDKATRGEFSVHALMPLMKRVKIPAAHRLFQVGSEANELFYILRGTILLPEVGKEIGPGSFLGEFALFSEAGRRTTTAVAGTDCVAMLLTKQAALSALESHPKFAIHLLRLITERMLQNAAKHDVSWPPDECVNAAAQESDDSARQVRAAKSPADSAASSGAALLTLST
jgi:CRP-like cAMP-binding protein